LVSRKWYLPWNHNYLTVLEYNISRVYIENMSEWNSHLLTCKPYDFWRTWNNRGKKEIWRKPCGNQTLKYFIVYFGGGWKRVQKFVEVSLSDYFKRIPSDIHFSMANSNIEDSGEGIWRIIDQIIFNEEIVCAISNLKRCKCHVIGDLLNEYFIEFPDLLFPVFYKLLNGILTLGLFPNSCSTANLISVFKKNDQRDPNNYLGITIVNFLTKLFTNIQLIDWTCDINSLLLEYKENHRQSWIIRTCVAVDIFYIFCSEMTLAIYKGR
jgi:hypothetical protein